MAIIYDDQGKPVWDGEGGGMGMAPAQGGDAAFLRHANGKVYQLHGYGGASASGPTIQATDGSGELWNEVTPDDLAMAENSRGGGPGAYLAAMVAAAASAGLLGPEALPAGESLTSGGFAPGAMSTAASSVDPLTLGATTGAPMSTTAALQATLPGASIIPGATQALPIVTGLPMGGTPPTSTPMNSPTAPAATNSTAPSATDALNGAQADDVLPPEVRADATANLPKGGLEQTLRQGATDLGLPGSTSASDLTTGSSLVDKALTTGATTALTGGVNATGGQGGDTTAADQQSAEEARRRGLIDSINGMYDPANFTGEENDLSNSIRSRQGDALQLGYDKAERTARFDAARRSDLGGSAMADNVAALNRDNALGSTKIEDEVNSALAGLRSTREAGKSAALNLANAGSGPEAVNAASTSMKNAIDSARAQALPSITDGLFQNIALSNIGSANASNNAALSAYINSRGGGSLFPVNGRTSGYNVNY